MIVYERKKMKPTEFLSKIEEIYAVIETKENEQRAGYSKDGIYLQRISFEDIDLSDFFNNDLVPLFQPILDYYNFLFAREMHKKILKVYLAALCEMAKNGFIQGGILKTLDAYIGTPFIRSRHYDLLSQALASEKVRVWHDRGAHYYEETIIFEAGIPKKFHRSALKLFILYWKWMKGIDVAERREFLTCFVNDSSIYEVYIFDQTDYIKMKSLRDEMSGFREKTLKTCFRLEDVYCSIDEYQEVINSENIKSVCIKISERLGFKIQTVVRVSEIEKEFIDYAHRIGFGKFQKMLSNLSTDEKIILPTGKTTTKELYGMHNCYCGIHKIREVSFEVSYPIGLSISELSKLKRHMVIRQNQNYIYISEDSFEVEVDGRPEKIRQLIYGKEQLYIFIGKIPAAATAYIDGEQVQGDKETKISVEIRKKWDRDNSTNQLAIYIKEIKYSNSKSAMKHLSVSIDGVTYYTRHINQHGFSKLVDKWIPIPDDFGADHIDVDLLVNGENIETQRIELSKIMVFGFFSGIQVKNHIDLYQLYGDERLIVFAMRTIFNATVELEYLSRFQNYFVYLAKINLSNTSFAIEDLSLTIKNADRPYISVCSEYFYQNNMLCINEKNNIVLQVINILDNIDLYYLKVVHAGHATNIIIGKYGISQKIEIIGNANFDIDECGVWSVSLFREQLNLHEIQFVVLPKLMGTFVNEIYKEGGKVFADITTKTECFEREGEWVNSIRCEVGTALIKMIGNLVTSETVSTEVYNSKCGVSQQIDMIPNVWGIRILENNSELWEKYDGNSLSYDSLNTHGVFVCTTRKIALKIQNSENTLYRDLLPGFNKLGILRLIEVWRPVNVISLTDRNHEIENIRITCEPSINASKFSYEGEDLVGIFSYRGPIGVRISITAFAKHMKVLKVIETAKTSRFQLQLIIKSVKGISGEIVSFEARFDDQDSLVIAHHQVVFERTDHEIVLEKYINIMSLLEENSIYKEKESFENMSALSLIKGEQ